LCTTLKNIFSVKAMIRFVSINNTTGQMKKVLTLLSCLVTIAALAQQSGYRHPIPNASSAYSYKTIIADVAIGLPRYPYKLDINEIKFLGRQNDALLFADTLAGIVYWYNPHEDAVKVLGGTGGSVDLSNYYNKTQSDSRYLQTYIETDPNFLASAAHSITSTNITNWNTAFSWGNHAGLYKAISYVPDWNEITGKPDLSIYATVTSLNNYLLKSDTAGKWQPKGDYSYHLPFNGNASYYLGGDSALHALPTAGSGVTPGDTATLNVHTTSFNNLLYAAINHTHSFASLTSKPTTLSGYGITDAYPLTGNPSGFLTAYTETDPVWSAASGSYYTKTQADARYLQSYSESDPLALKISNNLSDLTNVATARTNLGLGSFATKNSLTTGDIPDISATYATQSQLTTTNSNVSSNTTAIAGKQATLVSGTNIKTINGTTILGSGDITISSGSVDVIVDNTLTGNGTDASPVGVDTTVMETKGAHKKSIDSLAALASPPVTITNNLTTTTTGTALDAAQGKVLKDMVETNTTSINSSVDKNLIPAAIKTSSYTAAANDFIKTDATSGTVPITLPTAPADKTRIAIKMIAVSGSNTTSFTTGGSDVINKAGGTTSGSLTLLNQAVTLQYESATAIWNVVSSDIPLSQLDTRFASPTLNVKRDYAAKGNAILLTDAVVTSGSTTVTSASAAFTSADVSKIVCIPYAGTGATVGQSHMTTIASVTDAHTIVLAAAPSKSIAGARTVTDAAISSGNNTLTSATANFTSGDIGKKIPIPGAGLLIANSGGSPLDCYIVSITSATQAVVSRKALATVSAQTVTIPGAIAIYGTDDATAIQNAMTAGAAANKPVLLEAGRYLISASLVPVANTKIIGYGAGASILQPVGSGFAAFQNLQTGVANALKDVQISDLEIDCIGVTASTYTTSNKAIYMRPLIRPIFKNLYIHDASASGIGCDWIKDGQIINNTIFRCGRQALEFGNGGGGAGIGIGTGLWTEEPTTIEGNNVSDCGNYGIFVESQSSNIQSKGIRIIGNQCRWNNVGIGDHATDGTSISGNQVEYNTGAGIEVSNGFVTTLYSTNGLISNNICRTNAKGISLTYKDGSFSIRNNIISGNIGTGTGIDCVYVSGGAPEELIIDGNLLTNIIGRGIWLESGTARTVRVTNNHIVNVGSSTSTRRPAILSNMTAITRLYVKDNVAYDSKAVGSKFQSYGLQLTAGTITRFVYDNNDFADNADGSEDLTGATITTQVTHFNP
jgi:hypothetical protein